MIDLRSAKSWCWAAQHRAHILVHDFCERLCRRERNVLLSQFDQRDVLLKQAGLFGELRLGQPRLHPSGFQLCAKDRHDIIRVGVIRIGLAGAGSGHGRVSALG